MNRDEGLAYLKSVMDSVMEAIGRETEDTSKGYKPALDSAFRLYIARTGVTTGLTDTVTTDAEDYCFTALLEAVTYDLVLPMFGATRPDFSVDEPLTNVKFSQTFRAMQFARNDAWNRAMACGYGYQQNVSAFRVNLDFNEPSEGARPEF